MQPQWRPQYCRGYASQYFSLNFVFHKLNFEKAIQRLVVFWKTEGISITLEKRWLVHERILEDGVISYSKYCNLGHYDEDTYTRGFLFWKDHRSITFCMSCFWNVTYPRLVQIERYIFFESHSHAQVALVSCCHATLHCIVQGLSTTRSVDCWRLEPTFQVCCGLLHAHTHTQLKIM